HRQFFHFFTGCLENYACLLCVNDRRTRASFSKPRASAGKPSENKQVANQQLTRSLSLVRSVDNDDERASRRQAQQCDDDHARRRGTDDGCPPAITGLIASSSLLACAPLSCSIRSRPAGNSNCTIFRGRSHSCWPLKSCASIARIPSTTSIQWPLLMEMRYVALAPTRNRTSPACSSSPACCLPGGNANFTVPCGARCNS